jgi:hypothetical protein
MMTYLIMRLFITVAVCYTVPIVPSNVEIKTKSNLLPLEFDVSQLTADEISTRANKCTSL